MRLLDADSELRRGLPDAQAHARRLVTAPRVDFDRDEPWPDGSNVLLLDGLVLRRAFLGRRPIAQLLGPGDIAQAIVNPGVLALRVEHVVIRPGAAAVLDAEFASTSHPWPSIADVLAERQAAQECRALTQLAILALPRVEHRLLAALWHLAERFGRMTREGARFDLELSHEVLGQMIGSARPSVSLACAELSAYGVATRTGRLWTLDPAGLDSLGGTWPPFEVERDDATSAPARPITG